MELDSMPYAHWMYASTRETIEALAERLKSLGYAIADHDWPTPGDAVDMPQLCSHCAETRCGGCETHWLLVVIAPYSARDHIARECEDFNSLYDMGEFTVSNTADAKAVYARLADEVTR